MRGAPSAPTSVREPDCAGDPRTAHLRATRAPLTDVIQVLFRELLAILFAGVTLSSHRLLGPEELGPGPDGTSAMDGPVAIV